jgi:ribosomal protein L27
MLHQCSAPTLKSSADIVQQRGTAVKPYPNNCGNTRTFTDLDADDGLVSFGGQRQSLAFERTEQLDAALSVTASSQQSAVSRHR